MKCLSLALKRLWIRLFQQWEQHPQHRVDLGVVQFIKARETYQAVTLVSFKKYILYNTVGHISRSLPLSKVKNRTIAYSFPIENIDFLVKTITSLDCNLHLHLQDHLLTDSFSLFLFCFAQSCFTFHPTHSPKANNYVFIVCQVLF